MVVPMSSEEMTSTPSARQRFVLPIRQENRTRVSAVDVRAQSPAYEATAPVRPPEGAPNVVVILVDDMGFGASSAFGGPCEMPVADRLAAGGLRYTRFHTTGMCSPTRAALLTGRNHHSVGMGFVTGMATPPPGYNAEMPSTAATVARVLTANGYATGAFGKMHETPRHEITPVGPFDRWPTKGEGFEKFYGFLGGEINHWYPSLYDGTTPVDQPALPEDGYHLSEDLVDQAIGWMRDVLMVSPERPFFTYLPFGATHAPFHVRREWVEKYRGRFDHGWDRQRELTLERQKELKVVPEDAELAPWVPGVPHWDELTEAERRSACTLMELYAGFAEHMDAQVGRLVDALAELGELENTLILYILGDNGASPEGGLMGTVNEYREWSGLAMSAEEILAEADTLGGPESWPHYPVGWAVAMDTPYQWLKQVASHYGGTRNGLIVHWPDGIGERGGLRHQWHHVVDIAPTILEAAGLPAPLIVDGAEQQPIDGTPMNYSFDEPGAGDRHTTQYFEIVGNRGIYHDGWVACAVHRKTPWNLSTGEVPPFGDDEWELYDTKTDWTQARDVASEHPERLEKLKELFLIEAARNQVLPLDDRSFAARRNASERERVMSMTFHPRTRRLLHEAVPNVIGSSFSVTASIAVPDGGATGVICAQGGRFSGYSLYCNDGVLTFCMNVGGSVYSYVRARERLTPGRHEVEFRFAYDGGGLGRGGDGSLLVDGQAVGEGRIERTLVFQFPIGEDFNVGIDPLTPVTAEYPQFDNAFDGEIEWVQIDLRDAVELTPEQALRVEMATE
jgi:arylsulfatase A-like enzyme